MIVKNSLRIALLLALTAMLPRLALAQARDGKSENGKHETRLPQAGAIPVEEHVSFTESAASRKASSEERSSS
jgi:hypothetical protein